MGRGARQGKLKRGARRREPLIEGTPFTEGELLRWADQTLQRLLDGRKAELLAVRIAGPGQLAAAEALRLIGQHRGLEVVFLVAGYTSPGRVRELRRRGALLAELPGEPPKPPPGAPLDPLEVARAAGEPQAVGETLVWPDPKEARRRWPDLPEEAAWRRLALSVLAARG